MSYRVVISRKANKRMGRLPAEAYERVDGAILALADEPRPAGCVKPKNREDWRVRVGDYRIVYGIDDERRVVEIVNVAHRGDVYR